MVHPGNRVKIQGLPIQTFRSSYLNSHVNTLNDNDIINDWLLIFFRFIPAPKQMEKKRKSKSLDKRLNACSNTHNMRLCTKSKIN